MDYSAYAVLPESEESRRHVAMFLGVMISLSGMMTFFVAARIYSRIFFFRRFMFADWLVVISFCLIWLSVCLACIGTRDGIGKHGSELSFTQYGHATFWFTISCFPSTVGLAVPKLAVVSLLCQVFDPKPWHKALLWSLTILGLLNSLVSGILGVFHCQPIQAAWDWSIRDSRCLSLNVVFDVCYYVTVYAAILDLWLAIYPALMLKDLNTNSKRRVGLTILLALGLLASGISFYKISFLAENGADFTYDMVNLLMMINAEATLIMIAVCAPTLYPIYQRLRETFTRAVSRHHDSEAPLQPDQHYVIVESDAKKGSVASSGKKQGYWTRHMQSVLMKDEEDMQEGEAVGLEKTSSEEGLSMENEPR